MSQRIKKPYNQDLFLTFGSIYCSSPSGKPIVPVSYGDDINNIFGTADVKSSRMS